MGMFDRVLIPCKNCNNPLEFQTKAGECLLIDYEIFEIPVEIAIGLNGDSEKCEVCGEVTTFRYVGSGVAGVSKIVIE